MNRPFHTLARRDGSSIARAELRLANATSEHLARIARDEALKLGSADGKAGHELSDYVVGELNRQAMLAANLTDLRQRIELAAWCTVTLQEDRDNWTGEMHGYFAYANRDEGGPNIRSHTVATASGMFEIETLDNLARALGVDVSGPALELAKVA